MTDDNDDNDNGRTQVNVRLSESQHGDWKRFVEESDEYRHLSELIRHSVQKEIRDDAPNRESGPSVADGQVGEVLTAVKQLHGRIDGMEDELKGVKRSIRGERTIADDTVTAVWNALPQGHGKAKTAEEIAEEADVPIEETRIALTKATENIGGVSRRQIDRGDARYYREVEAI